MVHILNGHVGIHGPLNGSEFLKEVAGIHGPLNRSEFVLNKDTLKIKNIGFISFLRLCRKFDLEQVQVLHPTVNIK